MDALFYAADKAEHDIDTLDDVLYHLGEIKDALESSDTETASSLGVITDLIAAAKAEKDRLHAVVADAENRERQAAERDYYRSVL